ncbi:hypothetical protein [Dyadobacter crusticola]|uniref:hypothetical protein n=1 Tax=Dyadobacter crusticola TaxID=292407 RepID=UPI0012FA8F91|nr:hypothetical protein [Dyadobacter crusticola]
MKDIIFIHSHAAPHLGSFYAALTERGLCVKMWYCTPGYSWKLLFGGSFLELVNPGIIIALFRIPKSLIVVQDWRCVTQCMILLLARSLGHVVCMCNDIAESAGRKKPGTTHFIRRAALRYLLFPRVDYFLYASEHSRHFYKQHGITARKLVSSPYHSLFDRLGKIKKRPRKYEDHRIYTSAVS